VAAIARIDPGLDRWVLAQELLDALGLDRGLIVHATRTDRPSPQGPAAAVAGRGGLDGVLFGFAGHQRAASGPVGSRSADLGLGAVDAQLHAVGGGVADHIGQGPQPHTGHVGDCEPAGGQERPDLTDGAGHGGTVDPIEHRQLA
jgi:hypothetical protein